MSDRTVFVPFNDPQLVHDPSVSGQNFQDVAALPFGGFVTVWVNNGAASSPDGASVFGRVFFNDGAPGEGPAASAEFAVNDGAGTEVGPQVAALDDGRFVVVWHVTTEPGLAQERFVEGQVFNTDLTPSGGKFRVPAQPEATFGKTFQNFPDVAPLSTGGFVVTWHSAHEGLEQENIYAQIYTASAEPVDEPIEVLETTTANNDAEVTALEGGGFAVSWHGTPRGSANWNVYTRVFDSTGMPLSSETLVNEATQTPAIDEVEPRLRGLEGGGFVVAWENQIDEGPYFNELRARVYDASGGAVSSEIEFYPEGNFGGVGVGVTALRGGGFALATSMADPENTSLGNSYFRIFDASGAATSGIIASDPEARGNEVRTNLVQTADGNLVTVWEEGVDSYLRVFTSDCSITLTGTPEADLLEGGPCDDTLNGRAGNDTLRGFDDADILNGADGNDQLFGGDGNDILNAGDGTDTVNGGEGADNITGGDTINDRRDVIYGGAGNDSIDAGYGNDRVFGQDDDDVVLGGFGADELYGQKGNDLIGGGAFSDLIFGGPDDDWINGGFGSDRINGGTGADQFYHAMADGHGADWIQDYSAAEGDILIPGIVNDDWVVRFAHTSSRAGERAGDDDVREAFVNYRGKTVWALVDGEAQDSIFVQSIDLDDVGAGLFLIDLIA